MRLFLAILCLLAATACDEKSPIGPTVPLNEQFTLARGEAAVIQGTGARIQFVDVAGDSQRAFAVHRDLRIELRQHQPYPFSNRTIDPSDYRATLVVRR